MVPFRPWLSTLLHCYRVSWNPAVAFPWASWLVRFNHCFVHDDCFKLGGGNLFSALLVSRQSTRVRDLHQ